MLGTFLFTFMPAIVVAFALTLALKWAADLENGRLEVLFSTPQSRGKVLLARFGANVLVVVLAPILTWLAVLIGAQLAHLAVDQGRIFAASFNTFPMALITLGPGLRAGRTPALWRAGRLALGVYRRVLHGGIARGEHYDARLAHESLDLPRLRQPGLPRRQLDELPGHDRRSHSAAGDQPDPVSLR